MRKHKKYTNDPNWKPKKRLITFRLEEKEYELLQRIMKEKGQNKSEALRGLIVNE